MTEQQQLWFDKLVEIRTYLADALELSAASGVQDTVVQKYSDEAHFIYELLQNADDARAKNARFNLTSHGLFFIHDGITRFSISQPDTLEDKEIEKRDKNNGTLGHVNSICSIGNSAKKIESNSIGKFGVGFKSVFQYTETPHIYDPNFQFKIERFIIPVKLSNDLENRQKDETVFYFPFNKSEMPAEKAHSDILEKLKKLVFPTLFLSRLIEVKWEAETETGEYTKKCNKQKRAGDISYEMIELYQQIGLQQTKEKLYMFTRFIEENQFYSIGFFLDEEGKLTPKQYSTFCFFPTKEATSLNFIHHAPFLLTDNREGIHRSKEHNIEMVKLLAKLSADSLLILKELGLINDNIFEIIPYKNMDYGNDGFFNDFYLKIKEKLQIEEILPSKDNTYARKQNAYWADSPDLANLFTNEQLAELVNNKNAKWVFVTIGRTKEKEITDYVDGGSERSWDRKEPNLIKSSMDFENKIADLITRNFISTQSNEWLHRFYEYLYERKSYQDKFKTKPIFKDSQGNAVAAFEEENGDLHSILFLPIDEVNSTYNTIDSELLKNKKSKEFILAFGVKQPSLKDEIYNHILPLYDTDKGIDTRPHFELFFKYWKEEGRPEEFINLIKNKSFVLYKTNENEKKFRGIACDIYYPTPDLKKFFESKPNAKFVDIDNYYRFIKDTTDKKTLKEFLIRLGVRELPKEIIQVTTDWNNNEIIKENKLDFGINIHNRRDQFTTRIKNIDIDGLDEILKNIDSEKSFLLWMYITKYSADYNAIFEYAITTYVTRKIKFPSLFITKLKTSKWLLSTSNILVAPNEITKNELSEGYESNLELESLLEFKPTFELTEIERIASKFESEEDAELAKKLLDEHKARQNSNNPSLSKNEYSTNPEDEPTIKSKIEKTIKDLDDLQNEFNIKQKDKKNENHENETKPGISLDEDVEFANGIENLKKQLEVKKCRADLVVSINNSIKYSYDWFKSYLQLLTTYNEKQDTQKQKSISFQEIKPYKSDNKYFLLCGASSYFSPEIENADDFKVSLFFGSGKRENITVEGVSKKGQDLLIYCREPLSNNTLSRLSNTFKVEINFTPVIDLLDRLYKAFTNKSHIDEWVNIQKAIPPLNYIYGPPGTGKTTTLCNNINEVLSSNPNAKFLVLTPTNKASDVVCKKLKEINPDIFAVRLSRPTDPELEEYQIYRDTLDYEDVQRVDVVASTIHRLPYFDIQEIGLLFQYEWDYVIFDESSMIGLHYITFAIMALFKTNPKANFIVAGDPKQIPPVVEIDEKELENFDFQDENIYKMMNLESFNPKEQEISMRKIDTIQNLDKQYRSIPKIGQLFSELSYSSLLKHDRATNRKEVKTLPEKFRNLMSSNVIFVDIPLNQDNSIYRVNKLFYSSYHTYCAILVSEIIKFFDNTNKDEHWTIGIIAPYKAQAILLNKLITSYGISEHLKVISDTVHGFQGDECDIVFFVCNPNNYFFTNHEKALLSKEYIYNVAISRAKDYLIILHPYSVIPNNFFIKKIRHSYKTNFGNTKILNASDIENILFNERNYIENNSYVSGHDNVNVFGLSEMKYFIKANDTAIDIQLRELK